ncbi:MAG: helix-turn-helix domain-containing protein [Candidatus Protistobacter heckmanni]|nr:helix-turn-helix domain-containing protein [Candidatus Protistobacter heckmanni]
MPRRSSRPVSEKVTLTEAGTASVDKALSLLFLFTRERPELSLGELAEETGIYKSGILRHLASLEAARLVEKQKSGGYKLGAGVAVLNAAFQAGNDLESLVMPVLRELVETTRESAAFHVRQGDQRLCLFRVDSKQLLRDHTRAGDLLPLDRGAGGRMLTAFAGARGKVYERARKEKVLAMQGEEMPELAGISSPVFDERGELAGAITLTMASHRFKESDVPVVKAAARKLTGLLGGRFD